jgi:predicted RNase H-like nuclease (RuvC/YqgF family)
MLAASASSAQSCNDCIQIPRSTFELSKKAVDEVEAARILIDRQEREIQLLQENTALKDQVIEAQREVLRLKDERISAKEQEVENERTARELTEKQLVIETKEKEKAQRSAKFWRKIGTVAGGALAAFVFLH